MADIKRCVMIGKRIELRECLVRHKSAQIAQRMGKKGFNPCLHCNRGMKASGEDMGKTGECIDCHDTERTIVSHGRCWKCLKTAREKGAVPPRVSRSKNSSPITKAGDHFKNTVQSSEAPQNHTIVHFNLDGADRLKLQNMVTILKSAARDAEEIGKLINMRLTRIQDALDQSQASDQTLTKYIEAGEAGITSGQPQPSTAQ